MDSVTRRSTLRAIALAGATGLAGCSTLDAVRGPNERPPGSIGTSWSPPADEWHFSRADIGNTARSPTDLASAPGDLAVAGNRCYVGGRRRGVAADG